MKICIIGMPRSRSSLLLETLSNFYNIPILGKEINLLQTRYGEEYIERLKTLLDLYSSSESGIIRLHPLQLIAYGPFRILNLDWFNFFQYDKIFSTIRYSIPDNIASNFVASKLNTYTYQHPDKPFTKVGPYIFTEKDKHHIRDYIQSTHVLEELNSYFIKNNLGKTTLEYNEIPFYIRKNYPNTWVSHVETEYQYNKIITNYDEIINYYNIMKNGI